MVSARWCNTICVNRGIKYWPGKSCKGVSWFLLEGWKITLGYFNHRRVSNSIESFHLHVREIAANDLRTEISISYGERDINMIIFCQDSLPNPFSRVNCFDPLMKLSITHSLPHSQLLIPLVAGFFLDCDLTLCSTVCKAARASFLQRVWHDVH